MAAAPPAGSVRAARRRAAAAALARDAHDELVLVVAERPEDAALFGHASQARQADRQCGGRPRREEVQVGRHHSAADQHGAAEPQRRAARLARRCSCSSGKGVSARSYRWLGMTTTGLAE
jgi:hypothetical protein